MDEIPIALIEHNSFASENRFAVDDLAESLFLHGLLSPIGIRPHPNKEGKYEVIFGNRRLWAAKKLDWKTIAAKVIDASESEMLTMVFSENSDRKDFSDYEKALLMKRIHEVANKPYNEVALMIGRSPSYVSQHVAMIDLFSSSVAPDEQITRVLHSLTEYHARILMKITDMDERWNTAKLVVAAKLGVRELARLSSKRRQQQLEPGAGLASISDRQTLQIMITEIVIGLSSKDIRPFFDSVSSQEFDMFSAYPPFNLLNVNRAKDYLCDRLSQMHEYNRKTEFLDIRLKGNFAYAIIGLVNEGHMIVENKFITTRTRGTLVFEKQNGSWKMVHAHWSAANPLEINGIIVNNWQPRIRNERSR